MGDVVTPFEPLLNRKQLAKALNMSVRWVSYQQADHGLPFRRLGGGVRYKLSDVMAWLDAQQEQAS